MKKGWKIVLYIFLTLLLWFVTHTLYTVVDGLRDNGRSADYAVIPGTTVEEDGTPSGRLDRRLECAVNLYASKRVKGIIVSGGMGQSGFYEGTRMKDILLARGIPSSVIFVDNNGTNTRNTVKSVLKMRDELQFDSLIVVTQYFHATRIKMAFRKEGFDNISSVAPIYFELRDLYWIPREFVAFYTQIW